MAFQFKSNNTRYNNKGPLPRHIAKIEDLSQMVLLHGKEFFPGTCYACGAMPSFTGARVLLCAGCQLVSYCNKNCQRTDWKIHKIACKQFPVEMGKNIIVRKSELVRIDPESVDPDIRSLFCDSFNSMICEINWSVKFAEKSEEVSLLERTQSIGVSNIFLNARVCRICHEAQNEKLLDCHCCSVSYCSESHRAIDTDHSSEECDVLYGHAMANWYLTQHRQLQIPDGLLNEGNLDDGVKFEKVSKLSRYSSEKWLEAIVHLINVRLTIPLTIHHALKNLKLGEHRKGLYDITSLTIHIVHNAPMLDPRMWEFMLHQLPNLNILNLTFIHNHMKLNNPYNTNLPVERCSGCKRKRRVINYSIHPIHYHEYFSSDYYVEPDVVTVFDTTNELIKGYMRTGENLNEALHFTSQGNMTYNKFTVVILTDSKVDLLEACVENFHDARPVKVLLPVQDNPASRLIIKRVNNSPISLDTYVCCIQGNH